MLENGYTFEGVAFGFLDYSASANTRGGEANLRLPGDLGLALTDFAFADSMQIRYTARMSDAELNLWRQCCNCNWSYMHGFRYINYHETFGIHAINVTSESDYDISSENDLFGAQLGGKYDHCIGNLEFQVIGKAGVFDNECHQNTRLFDNANSTPVRNSRTEGSAAAFMGEVGATGIVRLNHTWLVRGGYNLMWLNRVVRAPDQLDFTNTATSGTELNRGGTVFMHGATVGLEANF